MQLTLVMLPAFEIFSTMAGVVFLTITTYGVLTENKSLLALGICLFSIIPRAGEIYLYSLSSKPIHLIFLLIFLSQLIISLPTKSNPKVAFGLSKKASFAILIINLLLSTPLLVHCGERPPNLNGLNSVEIPPNLKVWKRK